MFKDSSIDIDELTDVICLYVNFCESMIIPTKRIKVYPNNKPWMSRAVTYTEPTEEEVVL